MAERVGRWLAVGQGMAHVLASLCQVRGKDADLSPCRHYRRRQPQRNLHEVTPGLSDLPAVTADGDEHALVQRLARLQCPRDALHAIPGMGKPLPGPVEHANSEYG